MNKYLEKTMITLDAFLVFLGAAALPVIYILLVSRWIEPEYRRAYGKKTTTPKTKPAAQHHQALQPA